MSNGTTKSLQGDFLAGFCFSFPSFFMGIINSILEAVSLHTNQVVIISTYRRINPIMSKKKSMEQRTQSTIDHSKQSSRIQSNLDSTEPGHHQPNRPSV
jgi:hypothetical protein